MNGTEATQVLSFEWLSELETLIARHSQLGIGAEVNAMDLQEKWALLQRLRREDGSSGAQA